MASCKGLGHNNVQQPVSAQDTNDKHTVEYITQRLNDIYSEAFREKDHDLIALDHRFMSQEYNRLQDQAVAIAERIDDHVIDADHWVLGQDWTYPTMTVAKIEGITPTHATAHVAITSHMPGNDESTTQLILPLCLSAMIGTSTTCSSTMRASFSTRRPGIKSTSLPTEGK